MIEICILFSAEPHIISANCQNILLSRLPKTLARGSCTPEYFRIMPAFAFHPDMEAVTTDQILPMVEYNLGIGFYPEELARDALKSRTVCRIPLIEEAPNVKSVFYHQPAAAPERGGKRADRGASGTRIRFYELLFETEKTLGTGGRNIAAPSFPYTGLFFIYACCPAICFMRHGKDHRRVGKHCACDVKNIRNPLRFSTAMRTMLIQKPTLDARENTRANIMFFSSPFFQADDQQQHGC